MIEKKNNFKISVIIPSLNRISYLPRAINSILIQTYPVDEVILVDNGSNDGTVNFIRKNYKNIKILHESRKGVSHARNTGIKYSQNDWIAFLDSDDEWLPRKIEEQVRVLEESKSRLQFIHTNELWFENNLFKNKKKKHKKRGGYIFEECLEICKISPSSVIIKKKLFEKYGLFDEKFKVCEDYDLWLRLTSNIEIGYLEKPLIKKYGGHKGQLSKKYWGIDRYRIKALEKLIQNREISIDQEIKVLDILLKKINIVLLGAINRVNFRILKMYIKKKYLWEEYCNKYE